MKVFIRSIPDTTCRERARCSIWNFRDSISNLHLYLRRLLPASLKLTSSPFPQTWRPDVDHCFWRYPVLNRKRSVSRLPLRRGPSLLESWLSLILRVPFLILFFVKTIRINWKFRKYSSCYTKRSKETSMFLQSFKAQNTEQLLKEIWKCRSYQFQR